VAQSFGARVADISNLGSIVIFGAIGALPLATLADHFGRRRLIAAGVALFSLVNFATAFVPSLLALAAVRLTASCFENLVLGVVTALVVEEAPTARRGQAVSALALLFGLGQGIPVLIYPLVAPNWRVLFLAGGIGVLAAPLIWRRLPERSLRAKDPGCGPRSGHRSVHRWRLHLGCRRVHRRQPSVERLCERRHAGHGRLFRRALSHPRTSHRRGHRGRGGGDGRDHR